MYLGDTKADIPGRGVALGQRTASQEHDIVLKSPSNCYGLYIGYGRGYEIIQCEGPHVLFIKSVSFFLCHHCP